MATGGGPWLQPLLAATLADDYGPVRFVAARSLRSQPGMAPFQYDFLADPARRAAVATQLMEAMPSHPPERPPDARPERLQTSAGPADIPRIREALARQDKRSITVSE